VEIIVKMKGIPFIVSAPSGAGKTTLCKMAVDFFPNLRHSISYTTRPPRDGEVDGVDYRFIGNAEFTRMVASGEFLEHAGVHGKNYGTSRKDLEAILEKGTDVILDIDVQGAGNVRGSLAGGVFIFILPPSVEACEQRLRGRAKDSEEEIKKRLRIALDEIKKAPDYDYIIINDDLDVAFERRKSIIKAEKVRTQRMIGKVRELFGGA
jgi:guanylate kinase